MNSLRIIAIISVYAVNLINVVNAIRLIGVCNDNYGCNNCAGYQYVWCNGTQSCLRLWEQNCLVSSM